MKAMSKAVLTGIVLALAAGAAKAETALQQLAREAGADAAPIAARMGAAREAAAPGGPLGIPRFPKDAFDGCTALDSRPIMPWTPAQAALMVQTCINHAYTADGSGYLVKAEAARFGVRACPPEKDGQMSCQAIREVVGVRITVTGSIKTGDSVLMDLNYAVSKRGAKLMGFDAIVVDDAEVLR